MGKSTKDTVVQIASPSVLNRDLEVYDNTTEAAIQINESKARLIYSRHANNPTGSLIWSLFSTFITCFIAASTASFNDILGIKGSANILCALFIFGAVASGLITLVFFIKWLIRRKKYNEDTFIAELKGR